MDDHAGGVGGDDERAWLTCDPRDRWVFDKLLLALHFGYRAGPAGVDVPVPGRYVIRPVINVSGMGVGAVTRDLDRGLCAACPPGHFWCQWFAGSTVSVDYVDGRAVSALAGVRSRSAPLYRFDRWVVVEPADYPFPDLALHGRYERVNVEWVGMHPIEVHLRGNPDPPEGSVVQWSGDPWRAPVGHRFVEAVEDGDGFLPERRVGFWVRG